MTNDGPAAAGPDPYTPAQHLNYAALIVRSADEKFADDADARDLIRLSYEQAQVHIALATAQLALEGSGR